MLMLKENLIALRKSRGLSQNDIALKLYVSRQAVSKWERGESTPDVDTIIAISQLYDVSVDELLKEDLSQNNNNTLCEQDFKSLKIKNRKDVAKKMIVFSLCAIGIYALICGIIFTSLVTITPYIWLIWFTLPIVPPIALLIAFRHYLDKRSMMFFINMPFIAGLIYLIILNFGNSISAWIAFLTIPTYYAIALIVAVAITKQKSKNNI